MKQTNSDSVNKVKSAGEKERNAAFERSTLVDAVDPTQLERLVDSQYILKRLPLSKRSLQRLRSNGILPYIRIGNGNVMYREQDVQEMIMKYYRKGKNG